MALNKDIWDDLLGVVTDVGTALAQQLLITALGSLLGKRGIFDDLLASLGGVVSQVTGTVSNVIGSLGAVGGVLLDSVTPHVQDLQDQLTNHALNAAQSLLGTLSGISGTLQGRQLADAFGALLDEALGHLTSIATSLLNVGLASVLGALAGKRQLADAFGALLDEALGHLTSIATSLLNVGLASVLGALASGKRDIWDDILGVVTDVGTALAQQLLITALGSLLGKRGIFDDLLASLGGVVSQVTGTVSNVIGSLGAVGGVLLDSVTPHVQDLQDQLTNHALNAAQSLLGTLSGISGTLQG